MPHIRIRALSETAVQKLSVELPPELAKILQTPVDNFTVEKIAAQFYKDGHPTEGDPMVEVFWFDRGQEMKNACAKKITELVQRHSSAGDFCRWRFRKFLAVEIHYLGSKATTAFYDILYFCRTVLAPFIFKRMGLIRTHNGMKASG